MIFPTRHAVGLRASSFVASFFFAVVAGPAGAQAPPAQRVHFEPGKHSVALQGTFSERAQGDRDYIVKVAANHVLVVKLEKSSPSIHFNVLPPGDETALVNTSESGGSKWEGVVPADGDYTVRVYLLGGIARKGNKATYTLRITMPPVDPDSIAAAAQAAKNVEGKDTPLVGTTWRLVSIQRKVDGRQTPGDRTYTITFGPSGKVDVRADCNRGHGTVTAGQSGSLMFGPLAMTRAACPPGSLHDMFVGDMPSVRSYRIKERTLYLDLIADNGTYEFQRVGP